MRRRKLNTGQTYLSTLSEYVETLSGRLKIRAFFPEREVRITQFEELA